MAAKCLKSTNCEPKAERIRYQNKCKNYCAKNDKLLQAFNSYEKVILSSLPYSGFRNYVFVVRRR